MSFFSKILNGKSIKESDIQELVSPYGLGIGSKVEIDALNLKVNYPNTILQTDYESIDTLTITSYSVTQYSDEIFIHKFHYDSGYFEVVSDEFCSNLTGAVSWYQFLFDTVLLDDQMVDDWIGEDGMVGQPTFTLENEEENNGIMFHRTLYSDEDRRINVERELTVYKSAEDYEQYNVEAMEYSRILDEDLDSYENLIVEVIQQEYYEAKIHVGVELKDSDLTITRGSITINEY